MPSSPAVLAAQKKGKSVKFSSYAAAISGPKASTSTSLPQEEVEDNMLQNDEDGDAVADEGGWEQRTSVGHPNSTNAKDIDKIEGHNIEDEDEDDTVMIDLTSLLPPSSTARDEAGTGAARSNNEQGLLSFPALSAKDAQGKIETQSRRVSVSCHPL